jgi:CHASE3 domain sensor protein
MAGNVTIKQTSVSHRSIIIILVLIITLGNIAIFNAQNQLYYTNNNIIQSFQTIRATNQVIISINDASEKISDFLLDNNEESLKNLNENIISAQINLSTLDQLIQDDKNQLYYFKQLQPLILKKLDLLTRIMSEFSNSNRTDAIRLAKGEERFKQTRDIDMLIIQIRKIETAQLNNYQERFKFYNLINTFIFILENLLCIVLLVYCFVALKK